MNSSTCPSAPSINVGIIDDQHAVLIEQIERLEQAMAVGKGAAALPQIIRDLDHCASYHFPTEERFMASCGYPLRDMHAIEHGKFLIRVREIERMMAEEHVSAAVQLLNRLRGWIERHMMEWDAKLGEFLNSRGVA
jgi:hemerythrin-like metal-binding protein